MNNISKTLFQELFFICLEVDKLQVYTFQTEVQQKLGVCRRDSLMMLDNPPHQKNKKKLTYLRNPNLIEMKHL